MDDDGSKSLDLSEFKKGLHDYGLTVPDKVRHANSEQETSKLSCILRGRKNMLSDLRIFYCTSNRLCNLM